MLRVHEIFESISGECGGFPQGTWCTFIRLQGCNLRCRWCDTPTSLPFSPDLQKVSYRDMAIWQICRDIRRGHVLVTGGEPLLQDDTPKLISALLERGHEVQVETSGSILPPPIGGVYWVIDDKCPSSGMKHHMFSIPILAQAIRRCQQEEDEVYMKWVVVDEKDLEYAVGRIEGLLTECNIPCFLSPVNGTGYTLTDIVAWLRERGKESLLDRVAFSIQLHKLLVMP